MDNKIYSVMHIHGDSVGYMESFTTRKRAETVFSFIIQEKCPDVTSTGVKMALKEQLYGSDTESFHLLEQETSGRNQSTNVLYSVVYIQESYIEFVETFSTKANAEKVFSFMIKEQYPYSEQTDIKDALKNKRYGSGEDCILIVDHKIS